MTDAEKNFPKTPTAHTAQTGTKQLGMVVPTAPAALPFPFRRFPFAETAARAN